MLQNDTTESKNLQELNLKQRDIERNVDGKLDRWQTETQM